MKTQIELARGGIITEQMQTVASDEKIDATIIRDRVAKGQIVIPNNPFRRGQQVVGIGRGLRELAWLGTRSRTACRLPSAAPHGSAAGTPRRLRRGIG